MKIPVNTIVIVDGAANQWPFERICERGTVVANDNGYLVRLHVTRDTLLFKRKDLTVPTE
jgi:hypothetical protein